MDPRATLDRFLDALDNNDKDTAREAHGDLKDWLDKGGFRPQCDQQEWYMFENFSYVRGASSIKPLLFPDAMSFWDIFQYWTTDGAAAADWDERFEFEDYSFRTGKYTKESIPIRATIYGTSPTGQGFGSVFAKPRPEVITVIKQNMIAAGVNDRITFKMIWRRSAGDTNRFAEILLTAENSTIIGGRWLAIVDVETVPDWDAKPLHAVMSKDGPMEAVRLEVQP
jgi:hypothetical protein